MNQAIEEVTETYAEKAWKAFLEMRFGRREITIDKAI